jgi:hypothetical protein
MTRTIVLVLALVFLLGFAVLTIGAVASEGLTPAAVLSVLILVLLAVGIIGALRHPPR